MSDLSELIKRLKAFRDAIPDVMPQVATSVSMSAKALAERTIKDKGFGKTYSTTEVPAFLFYGKELNKRGKTYIETLEKNADEENPATTNWGEFRAAQGLQNKFVDLTYSGKMWSSMFPQDVQVDLFRYVAPLGSTNKEGQNKMNWNYDRYGDFIYDTLKSTDADDVLHDIAYDELVRLLDEKLKL